MQPVLVIGLDCASPRFLFGPEKPPLPFLDQLRKRGRWGILRSCDPPITVPAWSCMFTGRDPGELGSYGFRDRTGWGYADRGLASSRQITAQRVWDAAGRAGKSVVVLGVPQTYPAAPVNGCLVSGLLTPNTDADYTYPSALKTELQTKVGPYSIDVEDYRTTDKHGLLQRIHDHLDNRFAYARYLIANKPWDLFIMVETGLDRLHHAFWQYADPHHPRYEPDNDFADVVPGYYRRLDDHIATLAQLAGEDVAILIVSDHGAKAFHGVFRLNEWLAQEGYLRFRKTPKPNAPISPEMIDWSQTRAWGEGGYCGRIYINRRGREPHGIVAGEEYESVLDQLAHRLQALPTPDNAGPTQVLQPRKIYRETKGYPPDLLVYAGDLYWRCSGAVRSSKLFSTENDIGPDGANHGHDGIAILAGPPLKGEPRSGGGCFTAETATQPLNLLDVAPTLRDLLSLPSDPQLQGRSWLRE